jgi:hypothetical protein
MIEPPFIEGEGMPIKIRTDADENRADVTVLPVLRDGESPSGRRRTGRGRCSTCLLYLGLLNAAVRYGGNPGADAAF